MMDYNKIQPIAELYGPVPQSEGSKAGIPHIVVRTTGCTHRCFFAGGGFCDTWYTSIHPVKGKYSLNQIYEYFVEHDDINHLMLTGGSPTMHPELCNEIINIFKRIHYGNGIVTLETEGSHFIQTDEKIDLISMSPKFSNTIPQIGDILPGGGFVDQKLIDQHNKFRLNKDVIRQMFDYHADYQFKPVCNPVKTPLDWLEIENFRLEMKIPKSKTWIMPPGDNRQNVIENMVDVIQFCGDNGYCYSGRDHIIAFGDKREV